jgi:hypothetical protein
MVDIPYFCDGLAAICLYLTTRAARQPKKWAVDGSQIFTRSGAASLNLPDFWLGYAAPGPIQARHA